MVNNKEWNFDSWAGTYDKSVQENDWIHENYAKNIDLLVQEISQIANEKKINLLDVGAGTGNLISKLIKNPNIEFLAIEPSQKMREEFQKKCPTIEIIDGNLPKLPALNMEFDVIVSSYVIHHVEHERSQLMVQTLKRLLKSDGKILFLDVMFENKNSFDFEISNLKQQGLDDRVEEMLDEYFYFVDELNNILNREGIGVITTRLSHYVWLIKAQIQAALT
jgi:putative AdoMet-dependent methyltransferase